MMMTCGKARHSVLIVLLSALVLLTAWANPVALAAQEQSASKTAGAREVIATVDGEPITMQDFYIALSDAAGRPILDQLIGELLLRQAAIRAGVSVSKEEVEREFEGIRQQIGPDFDGVLAQYGMTADDLRRNIEISLLAFKVSTKDVVVTDEEIVRYYDEHAAEFESPEKVRASHILVDTEEDAQAALDRITAGAEFADVAADVSMDPMTAQNGGDLGFFAAGELVAEFEEAAFALGVGKISGIVKTDYGYHIIQVTDKAEPRRASFEEVSSVIERLLRSAHALKPADLIARLKAASTIVVFDPRFGDLGTAPLP